MSNRTLTVTLVISLMLLIVVGLLASRIGGYRIRASHQIKIGRLTLNSNHILPGVPVNVSYDIINPVGIDDASLMVVRTAKSSTAIGKVSPAELETGKFTIKMPCDSDIYEETQSSKARLVLISDEKGVLAQSGPFTMLPPGPECAYQ